MKISNCCGAELHSPWDDIEMCPDCKEHCVVEDEEEQMRKEEYEVEKGR
jgi:hypothetical protein